MIRLIDGRVHFQLERLLADLPWHQSMTDGVRQIMSLHRTATTKDKFFSCSNINAVSRKVFGKKVELVVAVV